jgi:hypothetical protein
MSLCPIRRGQQRRQRRQHGRTGLRHQLGANLSLCSMFGIPVPRAIEVLTGLVVAIEPADETVRSVGYTVKAVLAWQTQGGTTDLGHAAFHVSTSAWRIRTIAEGAASAFAVHRRRRARDRPAGRVGEKRRNGLSVSVVLAHQVRSVSPTGINGPAVPADWHSASMPACCCGCRPPTGRSPAPGARRDRRRPVPLRRC